MRPFLSFIFSFILLHTCSIGFISGDKGGQFILSIWWSLKYSFTILARCGRALSSTNTNYWQHFELTTKSPYLSAFTLSIHRHCTPNSHSSTSKSHPCLPFREIVCEPLI
ncbi:unnamed protein product [Brassicogethes aeneus]|uniref:Secreted protein n=1 Tax=Brassicogethes aeneus TaxID=1431903 RepID=A0A9P0AXM8_BRAAE|nr:unnamed protein product [Brassicogethes aeneus]